VKASGTIYIRADGSIDPSDAPISTADNITYTFTGDINDSIVIERDNIMVDGVGYTLEGTNASGSVGTDVTGRRSVTIKNTNIKNFWYGIHLDSSSSYNSISGNNITNNTYDGIVLDSSSSYNSIFGNSIATNYVYGISLYYSSSNSIFGNNITNSNIGIYPYYSSSNSISGNNITNNTVPIELITSSGNSIPGNNITDNDYGIEVYTSSGNSISGNNIAPNNNVGIGLYSSSGNSIFHNNFINNARQAYSSDCVNVWDCGYLSGGNHWSDYNGTDQFNGPYQNMTGSDGKGDKPYIIDADNQDRYPLMYSWIPLPAHNMNTGLAYTTIQEAINANETQDGDTIFVEAGTYFENVVLNKSVSLMGENEEVTIIDGNENGTVVVVFANNTMITGFTIRGSGDKIVDGEHAIRCGIMVGGYETPFENTLIVDNSIKDNYFGILLLYSFNSQLIDNNINNNTYGVALLSVFYNEIVDNNVSDNFLGITAQGALQSSINRNNISSNEISGLRMQYSNLNTINENTMENNGYGIDLSFCEGNMLVENNITTNNVYGLYLGLSSNNSIYHNNFTDNLNQAYSFESTNVWDNGYPSGGNYWSNYTGTDLHSGFYQNDTGSDGIGDTPYVIDENNRDRYPLGVFHAAVFGDLNGDGIVDILDAVQAASSFGSYPGHPNWDIQADLNHDNIIDIFDIISLANNFGKH
jgi:parallel beta-helix repeat protein